MKSSASYNIRRTIASVLVALFCLLVVVPLIYEWSGVHLNSEERGVRTVIVVVLGQRTATSQPKPLPTQIATAETPPTAEPPAAPPAAINGIPIQRIIYLSDSTRAHIHDIFSQGQELGRDAHRISKIGDSTMVYPAFLATFDNKTYNLGRFSYLQGTIDFEAGSLGRVSAAVKKGMHTWSQFDPAWTPPGLCAPLEGPLACELRLQNPSVAVIRLGANDTDYPIDFQQNLTAIVKYCLERGIIPVLGTKPDRYEGQSNLINNLIRKVAAANSIPLWDYDLVAATVPGRGLEPDHLHIAGGGTRDFRSSLALHEGDALEDLTGLMMLDTIRREIGPDATLASVK